MPSQFFFQALSTKSEPHSRVVTLVPTLGDIISIMLPYYFICVSSCSTCCKKILAYIHHYYLYDTQTLYSSFLLFIQLLFFFQTVFSLPCAHFFSNQSVFFKVKSVKLFSLQITLNVHNARWRTRLLLQ